MRFSRSRRYATSWSPNTGWGHTPGGGAGRRYTGMVGAGSSAAPYIAESAVPPSPPSRPHRRSRRRTQAGPVDAGAERDDKRLSIASGARVACTTRTHRAAPPPPPPPQPPTPRPSAAVTASATSHPHGSASHCVRCQLLRARRGQDHRQPCRVAARRARHLYGPHCGQTAASDGTSDGLGRKLHVPAQLYGDAAWAGLGQQPCYRSRPGLRPGLRPVTITATGWR